MKLLLLAAIASLSATSALAMHSDQTVQLPADPHAGHAMESAEPDSEPGAGAQSEDAADPTAGHGMHSTADPAATPPEATPPPEAFTGPAHAADTIFDPAAMTEEREQLRAEQGEFTTYRIMLDRLEIHVRGGDESYLWDGEGWYGGDIDKLWIKTEGEGEFDASPEEAEVQVLWSHAITPWLDLQSGGRYDFRPTPQRAHLVVGLLGLVPYEFEIDAAAFLSNKGDFTARLEAEYDQLITQRLVLQPRIELNLAAQDVPEIDLGAGLSSVEAGMRLRYELRREFAPYIGVEYERTIGNTADFARADGEDVSSWSFLAGVRVWF